MPQQGQYAQPMGQQQQYQPQHQQYPPRKISMERKPTSTGQWVLTIFLTAIPVVNVILMFVWAFGSSTEASKKNWARANLIWVIIGIVLTVALMAIGSAMGIDWQQAYQNYLHQYGM